MNTFECWRGIMATRLLFSPSENSTKWVDKREVDFTWFPGYSKSQKQRSIDSLHKNAQKKFGISKILEVSTKSLKPVGVQASAFKLQYNSPFGKSSSVERFYQGSKVFERGDGPNTDIYDNHDFRFKSDSRLREFGELKHFEFNEVKWELKEPFYDWLYLNALVQNPKLIEGLNKYDAFTDIEFNHIKAYNCQAYSVALYLSIKDEVNVENLLKNKQKFINFLKRQQIDERPSPESKIEKSQGKLDL